MAINTSAFPNNQHRFDPYKNFKFVVVFPGVGDVAAVSKVSPLKRSTEVVTHRDGGAVALADRAEHQEIANRLRHAQAVGDRRGVLPHRRLLRAGAERPHDRRAAGRGR